MITFPARSWRRRNRWRRPIRQGSRRAGRLPLSRALMHWRRLRRGGPAALPTIIQSERMRVFEFRREWILAELPRHGGTAPRPVSRGVAGRMIPLFPIGHRPEQFMRRHRRSTLTKQRTSSETRLAPVVERRSIAAAGRPAPMAAARRPAVRQPAAERSSIAPLPIHFADTARAAGRPLRQDVSVSRTAAPQHRFGVIHRAPIPATSKIAAPQPADTVIQRLRSSPLHPASHATGAGGNPVAAPAAERDRAARAPRPVVYHFAARPAPRPAESNRVMLSGSTALAQPTALSRSMSALANEAAPPGIATASASPRSDALLNPALLDRIADDVMRRMERRIRIERERRGL